MNGLLAYEFIAEAFRIDTGYMAPGKDPGIMSGDATFEERFEAWEEWNKCNYSIIRAFTLSASRILAEESDNE